MSGARRGRRQVSYRAALIRLLWRSVADEDTCDGQCEKDGSPLDICAAMRALGWGKHWSARVFQNHERFEPQEKP